MCRPAGCIPPERLIPSSAAAVVLSSHSGTRFGPVAVKPHHIRWFNKKTVVNIRSQNSGVGRGSWLGEGWGQVEVWGKPKTRRLDFYRIHIQPFSVQQCFLLQATVWTNHILMIQGLNSGAVQLILRMVLSWNLNDSSFGEQECDQDICMPYKIGWDMLYFIYHHGDLVWDFAMNNKQKNNNK